MERIARVRDAAAGHLRTLASNPLIANIIVGADALRSALPALEGGEAAGSVSLDSIPRLAALLGLHPAYTSHLLEGLVASVGGVDNTLARAASSALVDALHTASLSNKPLLPTSQHASSSTDTQQECGSQQSVSRGHRHLASDVAHQFLCLWQRHAKSSRLATPLLRCADLLVTKTDILRVQLAPPASQHTLSPATAPTPASASPAAEQHTTSSAAGAEEACGTAASKPDSSPNNSVVPPEQTAVAKARTETSLEAASPPVVCSASPALPSSDPSTSTEWFAHGLIQLARSETRMCTDVGRLLDAASLLCHLLATGEPGRTSALQGLLLLLVSKFPKVRRHTAEQLYLQLLTLTPEEEDAEVERSHGVSAVEDGKSTAVGTAAAASGVEGGVVREGGAVVGDSVVVVEARGVCLTEAVLDAAADVLLCTTWDGDIDATKVARDELAKMLRVQLPKMRAAAAAGRAGAQRDENSSYQSLIDDFARFR